MYDLDTRGQLVLVDGSFHLIRVLAEDVSIREAFGVADVCVDDGDIFFAPVGQPFVPGEWGPLMYQSALDIVADEDDGPSDHFTWGDELTGDDYDVHGFAYAVWEDGHGPRCWYPAD